MKLKILEIRDEGTHIPVLAIKMESTTPIEQYYLNYRCGFPKDGNAVVVMKLDDQKATSDMYDWGGRTMPVAHKYIEERFGELEDGDVIDVEFILHETSAPKVSERFGT